MNELTGKPIPPFTKFDFSKIFGNAKKLIKIDISKSKLFQKRQLLNA